MGPEAQIVCGDAVEVLRTLRAKSVALTVTSPPYFRHRDYGVAGQIGQEPDLDCYLSRIRAVLVELFRVTDDAGSCFVIVGDTYRNRKLLLVPHRIALAANDVGWVVRNDVIWHKSDPAPESPRNRWRSGHEHVLFFARRASGYRFDLDSIRVPYRRATLQRWGAGQSYGGNKSRTRRGATDSRMREGQTFRLNPLGCLPTDVWTLPASNTSAAHYATFPDQLVRPIIEACSRPGDLVLDPFVGVGTICRVAQSLGRSSLGIELNPEYVQIAARQLEGASSSAA